MDVVSLVTASMLHGKRLNKLARGECNPRDPQYVSFLAPHVAVPGLHRSIDGQKDTLDR